MSRVKKYYERNSKKVVRPITFKKETRIGDFLITLGIRLIGCAFICILLYLITGNLWIVF